MGLLKSCALAFSIVSMPFSAMAEVNNGYAPAFEYDRWTPFGTENDVDQAASEFLSMVFDTRRHLESEHPNVMAALDLPRTSLTYIPQTALILNDHFNSELVEMYDNAFTLEEIISFRRDFIASFSNGFDTNCYAYAVNDSDGGMVGGLPQPGQYTGLIPLTAMMEAQNADDFLRVVTRGAEFDGLEAAGESLPEIREGTYRVALMIREDGGDYHWIREGNDGIWSGKFGHAFPMRTDRAGNLITDPRTADFGDYILRQFFYVPIGGLDLQAPPITLGSVLSN
jgi:hypothetical protein